MRQPLPQEFPEYSIVKHPQGAHEFKVEAKSYFQSRNILAPYYAVSFDYAIVLMFPVLGAVLWQMVCMLLACPWLIPAENLLSLTTGPWYSALWYSSSHSDIGR